MIVVMVAVMLVMVVDLYPAVFPELFKSIACIFSEIIISVTLHVYNVYRLINRQVVCGNHS
jgi:hypothetical protein